MMLSSEFFLKTTHPPVPTLTLSTHTHIAMLQRTLFRASRQAARSLPRPQPFTPIRQPAAASLRWYSETPAAKEGESTATDSKPAEPSETTQLKEQIGKKDKEIVDLKVCNSTRVQLPHHIHTCSYPYNILTKFELRTNTSAPSLISAISKSARSARSPPQKTSPSNASPETSSNPSTTSTAP